MDDAVPNKPTMSLHDIAAKLWVFDKSAYYNLRYYIEERDRLIDDYAELREAYNGLRSHHERSMR